MLQENKEKKSVVFKWNPADFDFLLKSCEFDDEVKITLKYLKNKYAKILEAGCGLGRVVKYLYDRGFKHIQGVEIDKASVVFLNQNFPELDIIHADLLNLPYLPQSFDVILSYGVIEHFYDGPQAPLKVMYDLLKPGGIAVITVPSFNILRRMQYIFSFFDPKKNNLIRKVFGKKHLNKNKKRFSYYIDPQVGSFFEYRFTPHQFKRICKKEGFRIVESKPIAHVDGLFHIFGPPLITFKDWQFKLSRIGKVLNKFMTKIPFFHNHMHVCVVKK